MTTEQKIKELEKRIECEQALIKNCISHQENLRAEIADLKKPKYELFVPTKNDHFCFMHDDGTCSTQRQIEPLLDYSKGIYNWFKITDAIQCGYYAKQRQIFDALANFAAHNDPTEKDRAWDCKTMHYFLGEDIDTGDCLITCVDRFRHPTTPYFSTEELAEAAFQMLKDEKLIIV